MEMSDLETWVQCSQCSKWRCVPETMQLPSPWVCKYNVFDLHHNQCSQDQEALPDEPADASDDEDEVLELVPEDEVGMFTPSTCECTLCTDINRSVSEWNTLKDHHVPLVNMVIKAINKTAPVAHAVEEDKQFAQGVSIDLHHPSGPTTK